MVVGATEVVVVVVVVFVAVMIGMPVIAGLVASARQGQEAVTLEGN